MAPNENYFEILGVSEDAGYDQVERRYRQVRKEFEGNPTRLKLIDEAYRTLINPFKRKEYLKKIGKSQDASSQPKSEPADSIPGAARKHTSEMPVGGASSPSAGGSGKPVGGSRSKTQIIGGNSSQPARTPEPKPETGSQPGKSRSKTQIVGGSSSTPPRSPEPGSDAVPQPGKSRSKTQVVGSSQPGEPKPQPSPSAKPGGRSKTQVVGANQPPSVKNQEPPPQTSPQKAAPQGVTPPRKRRGTVIMGEDAPVVSTRPEPVISSKGNTAVIPPVADSPVVQKSERSITQPVTGETPPGKEAREISRPDIEHILQIWEAVVSYQGHTETFRLSLGENLVGRPPLDGPRPVVCLQDPEKFIGRRHATIIVQEKGIFIQDNESHNGTLLNGTKMQPNQPAALKEGDEVVIEGRRITIRPVRRPS